MPQGCVQRTLFEVAISFCSSLDEVMTGTLQKGSYASLFCWNKTWFQPRRPALHGVI